MAISMHPHAQNIPDPNDRTPNCPVVLVESRNLRDYLASQGIFHKVDIATRVYAEHAMAAGWDYAVTFGNAVLLYATMNGHNSFETILPIVFRNQANLDENSEGYETGNLSMTTHPMPRSKDWTPDRGSISAVAFRGSEEATC